MTPEEQRIAIAEACGWKWWKHTKSETFIFAHPDRDKASLDSDCMQWERCEKTPTPPHFVSMSGTPDYLNDLNAMHEADGFLRKNQFHAVDYPHWLFKVVSGLEWKGDMGYFMPNFTMASAPERAEAFLRTLNLWED